MKSRPTLQIFKKMFIEYSRENLFTDFVKVLVSGLGKHSAHPWTDSSFGLVSVLSASLGKQKCDHIQRETKIPSSTAAQKTIILYKNLKKVGEILWLKMQERDINLTKQDKWFVGFSIAFSKNHDPPSPVYHINQLQVLTQYFITVP